MIKSILSDYQDSSLSQGQGEMVVKGSEWAMKYAFLSATPDDVRNQPTLFESVDAIIFVIDSQKSHLEETKEAWNLLKQFYGAKLYEIPLIVALNKYDLKNRTLF